MSDSIKFRFVGLDTHAESITVAVADDGRGAAQALGSVPNNFSSLTKVLRRLGPPAIVVCCYEAGPTGFGLARQLTAAGWNCSVIAPSLVPKKPGSRVKTNRRDAAKLAHFLRSGDLTTVFIPDEDSEAIRDLSRARAAAKRAERVARQQLSKFLLRHGRHFTGTTWKRDHREWIAQQRFERPAQQCVLQDHVSAVDMASDRVHRLTQDLAGFVPTWDKAPLVTALQALRGIEMVSAVTIVAEICDFKRFATARELMGYLGLVPSEQSTGDDQHRGRITRTGNDHVRWTLVEAAWHYRRPPNLSKAIRQRTATVAAGVRMIAWKAQARLYRRMQRLLSRGKTPQRTVVALARELAGFVWAIAREEVLVTNET
jgi:transposase